MDATIDVPETTEAEVESPFGDNSDMAANAQPVFKALRDGSPVLALEGSLVLSRKADIDEALRHPEMFTSNMSAVDLKNVRPLIPLQIDPPEHKKYRKLLDPIFAPRLMTAMEEEVAVLVNRHIDGFIDRGNCDLASELAVPIPCGTFLRLLGLPLSDLDMFLGMKSGILRPTGADPAEMKAAQQATAAEIERWCEIIAAMKVRTTNRKGRHLSTVRILQLLVDHGVETPDGLQKLTPGRLTASTINRHMRRLGYDHDRMTRQPPAVRFQAEGVTTRVVRRCPESVNIRQTIGRCVQ